MVTEQNVYPGGADLPADAADTPPSVLDPSFRWSRGADVQATWRKYGWVPPSELRAASGAESEVARG